MQRQAAGVLGGVTVVCTSRTGALTGHATRVSEIRTATHSYRVTGQGFVPVGDFICDGRAILPADAWDLWTALQVAVRTSDADVVLAAEGWTHAGGPLDAALVVAARKAGIRRDAAMAGVRQVGLLRDVGGRGFQVAFQQCAPVNTLFAYVKGTPSAVLPLCHLAQARGGAVAFDRERREELLTAARIMGRCGLRVVALAQGIVGAAREADVRNLTFVGLIGIADPPAPAATAAIETLHQAGVRTVLLTRDQEETAVALASDVGVDHAALALDGSEVESMRDDDLQARLARVNIFSRATAQTIRRVICGLRERGEIVAVVGSPLQSASALSVSDIPDRAPATIEAMADAVRAARVRIDNARKLAFYVLSCGLAGIFWFAALRAFELPMAWRQGLWLALVTSLMPSLALASEPAQPDVMQRPPLTLRAGLVSRTLVRAIVLYGFALAVATGVAVAWSAWRDLPPARAVTVVFMTLAFAQLLHLGNARDRGPVLSPSRATANALALLFVAVAAALQMLTVVSEPLRVWLRLEPLAGGDWLVALGAAAIPATAGQLAKVWRHAAKRRRMRPQWPRRPY